MAKRDETDGSRSRIEVDGSPVEVETDEWGDLVGEEVDLSAIDHADKFCWNEGDIVIIKLGSEGNPISPQEGGSIG